MEDAAGGAVELCCWAAFAAWAAAAFGVAAVGCTPSVADALPGVAAGVVGGWESGAGPGAGGGGAQANGSPGMDPEPRGPPLRSPWELPDRTFDGVPPELAALRPAPPPPLDEARPPRPELAEVVPISSSSQPHRSRPQSNLAGPARGGPAALRESGTSALPGWNWRACQSTSAGVIDRLGLIGYRARRRPPQRQCAEQGRRDHRDHLRTTRPPILEREVHRRRIVLSLGARAAAFASHRGRPLRKACTCDRIVKRHWQEQRIHPPAAHPVRPRTGKG